jgi:hypothetical protein
MSHCAHFFKLGRCLYCGEWDDLHRALMEQEMEREIGQVLQAHGVLGADA